MRACIIIPLFVIFLAALIFAVPCLIRLLWNHVAPAFGGPVLDYWTVFCGWMLLGFVGGLFRQITKGG